MSANSPYPQDRHADAPRPPEVPAAPDDARPPEQAYGTPPSAAYPQYQQPQYQQPQYQQPPYQQPQYQQGYPPSPDGRIAFQPPGPTVEHPQATLAFVLGLLSVLGLLITGPFGWYVGRRVVRQIDQDPRQFSNRGLAMTGMVLGIIGTVLLVLVVALFVVGVVLAITLGASSSGY